MNQRKRTVLEVEGLEDRCTPAHFGSFGQVKAALLQVRANLSAHIQNHNFNHNHNHHNHAKVCAALQTAHDKLVARGAPPAAIAIVESLQVHFGC